VTFEVPNVDVAVLVAVMGLLFGPDAAIGGCIGAAIANALAILANAEK
jgi:hypothetical protein